MNGGRRNRAHGKLRGKIHAPPKSHAPYVAWLKALPGQPVFVATPSPSIHVCAVVSDQFTARSVLVCRARHKDLRVVTLGQLSRDYKIKYAPRWFDEQPELAHQA